MGRGHVVPLNPKPAPGPKPTPAPVPKKPAELKYEVRTPTMYPNATFAPESALVYHDIPMEIYDLIKSFQKDGVADNKKTCIELVDTCLAKYVPKNPDDARMHVIEDRNSFDPIAKERNVKDNDMNVIYIGHEGRSKGRDCVAEVYLRNCPEPKIAPNQPTIFLTHRFYWGYWREIPEAHPTFTIELILFFFKAIQLLCIKNNVDLWDTLLATKIIGAGKRDMTLLPMVYYALQGCRGGRGGTDTDFNAKFDGLFKPIQSGAGTRVRESPRIFVSLLALRKLPRLL